MSRFRELVADAGLHLHSSGNSSQQWLSLSRPENILERSALVRSLRMTAAVAAPVLGSAIRLGDQVIGYVGGDNPAADAAQWLWLNRRCGDYQNLSTWPSDVILRIAKACREWDAQPDTPEDKNYSLSDLRRAYDMGFAASGEGWNQEIHPDYLDKENYQAERLEALREFSKCK